jgi:hypothetical protein
MFAIKGLFQDGVARPDEPIEGREGQPVIITFLEEEPVLLPSEQQVVSWNTLRQLLQECSVETGIEDLAHQHDHYLYGKPKQN